MSTMDNASAKLAVALQVHDLDALETLGTVDKAVIRIQRQQLEVDCGFDAVTFEARPSTAGISSNQTMEEAAPMIVIEPSPSTADCASCGDHINIVNLVKASCEHYYCSDCFGQFVEASLQTHDGFPPKCCRIPIAFITIAGNVSPAVFSRYSARQAEIKSATALYCGVQGCGVRIESDRIKGVRATCVACWTDTCTLCRGKFPRRVNGENVSHICKKDKAREQVLALAKQEGWQTCYHCGNLVALNTGCHHMR